jgi:hypothetical protein
MSGLFKFQCPFDCVTEVRQDPTTTKTAYAMQSHCMLKHKYIMCDEEAESCKVPVVSPEMKKKALKEATKIVLANMAAAKKAAANSDEDEEVVVYKLPAAKKVAKKPKTSKPAAKKLVIESESEDDEDDEDYEEGSDVDDNSTLGSLGISTMAVEDDEEAAILMKHRAKKAAAVQKVSLKSPVAGKKKA